MEGSKRPSKEGFIHEGTMLSWKEIKEHAEYVRQEAVIQFINLYRKVKERKVEEAFVWGDEIEHMLVKLDDIKKTAQVLPANNRVLRKLNGVSFYQNSHQHGSKWMPEYGAHQVESTPGRPFSSSFSTFNIVEANMKLRRKQLSSALDRKSGEVCLTMTHLPRFGCENCCFLPNGSAAGRSEITKSPFYPDAVISPFERFRSLENNIRMRRGEHVSIDVPVFKDRNTESPFWDPYPQHQMDKSLNACKVDHIHADCSVAVTSCSCLQVTFQASDLSQAKYLYDQLIPMCPIMLALSASTPVFRGFLSDVDCRWNALSQSADSRDNGEREMKPLTENKFAITKSRCDTVSFYLTAENESLNDSNVLFEDSTFRKLLDGGVDTHMAQYISCILSQDPLILCEEKIHKNSAEETGHFYNIYSSNWQTMRLKPPAVTDKMGWRVEFRPLESVPPQHFGIDSLTSTRVSSYVTFHSSLITKPTLFLHSPDWKEIIEHSTDGTIQMTEFENAAYAVFIILLARSIYKFKLDLAAPISKVDLNMKQAHAKDAVLKRKFFFKEKVEPEFGEKRMYTEMSIDVIINGGVTSSGTEFPGLIPIINMYISTVEDVDNATLVKISRYLKLISDRASGRVKTTARWVRNFVAEHPDYKYDSAISETINYDLVKKMSDISNGTTASQHLNLTVQ